MIRTMVGLINMTQAAETYTKFAVDLGKLRSSGFVPRCVSLCNPLMV